SDDDARGLAEPETSARGPGEIGMAGVGDEPMSLRDLEASLVGEEPMSLRELEETLGDAPMSLRELEDSLAAEQAMSLQELETALEPEMSLRDLEASFERSAPEVEVVEAVVVDDGAWAEADRAALDGWLGLHAVARRLTKDEDSRAL